MRLVTPLRHGTIAPSSSDFSWSEIISSQSHTSSVPRPWHAGHAPRWLLKEKCFGVSCGSVNSVSGLQNSVEYFSSCQTSAADDNVFFSTTDDADNTDDFFSVSSGPSVV